MKILVDMDSTLADIQTPWLGTYNWLFGDRLRVDDIVEWDMHKFVKKECGLRIYDLILEPDFFLDLAPLAGGVECVHELFDAGHEVKICTSSPSGRAMWEKERWVRKHLPFLSKKQFGCWGDKSEIRCAAIIDDAPDTLRAFAEMQPDTLRLTIAWPYNECIKTLAHCYAESWKNTSQAWATMRDYILKR
jgi:5'-nucleotidase